MINKKFIVILSCFSMTGCATIISGSTQSIDVSSTPSGATVTVEPIALKTTTPGNLVLKRKEGPYRISFTLDGHESKSVMLITESNGWLWGNLLFGGLVGVLVDSSTGAASKLSPESITVNLTKTAIESTSSSKKY